MSKSKPSSHVWDCERVLRKRCPHLWQRLDTTPVADVRHCRECARDVYLCRTPADFVAHGELGHCVAIPDDLSPQSHERSFGLGEPSVEEVLREKELLDRSVAWWDEALLRQTTLSAEKIEAIRTARKRLADSAPSMSPEHLAILTMAVRDGGIRCPRCGNDILLDTFGIMILLETRQCEVCKEPIELELPLE